MNKKANTALFILGATIANVIIMLLIFIVLFIIFGRFIAPSLSPAVASIVVMVLFFAAIVLTYVIYNRLIKFLANKIDMEKYFDPIFKQRRGRSRE